MLQSGYKDDKFIKERGGRPVCDFRRCCGKRAEFVGQGWSNNDFPQLVGTFYLCSLSLMKLGFIL